MGHRPNAIAATGLSVTGWPGTPVTVTITPRPLPPTIRKGQPIARATITVGNDVTHIRLGASRTVTPPSLALAAHPALTDEPDSEGEVSRRWTSALMVVCGSATAEASRAGPRGATGGARAAPGAGVDCMRRFV